MLRAIRDSLSLKFALASVLLTSVLALAVGFAINLKTKWQLEENYSVLLQHIVDDTAERIGVQLVEITDTLHAIASNPLSIKALRDRQVRTNYLTPFLAGYSRIADTEIVLYLVDAAGKIVGSSHSNTPLGIAGSELARTLQTSRVTVNTHDVEGRVRVVLVHAILDEQSTKPIGAIVLTCWLNELLMTAGTESEIEDSPLVAELDVGYRDTDTGMTRMLNESPVPAGTIHRTARVAVEGPLSQLQIRVDGKSDPAFVAHALEQLAIFYAMVSVVAISLAAVASYLLGERLTWRLRRLERNAKTLMEKEPQGLRLDVSGSDEVYSLGESINRALIKLDAAYRDLQISSEQAIVEREEKYRSVFEQAGDAIFLLDPGGRVTEINGNGGQLLRLKEELIVGRGYHLFFPEISAEHFREMSIRDPDLPQEVIQTVLNTGIGPFPLVEIRSQVVYLGERRRLLWMIRDITQEKMNRDELESFRKILSNTGDIYSRIDRSLVFVMVNAAHCDYFGHSQEEMLGKPVRDFWPRDIYQDVILPGFADAFTGERVSYEQWFDFAGKGRRYLRVTYLPVEDEEGQIKSVAIGGVDLTALKELELNLRESEEKYRSLVEALNEGIVVQEKGGAILAFNDSATRILGVRPSQLAALWMRGEQVALFRENGSECPVDELPAALCLANAERIRDKVYGFARPDGAKIWLNCNAVPIYRGDGETPYAAVVSFQDVTRKRELAEHLRIAKERAERADRAKTEFVAMISHDIRTPLNVILAMSELINDGQLNEKQAKYITLLRNAGESLLTLISSILDISKIETGQLELESHDFDLRELVRSVVEIQTVGLEKKGLRLEQWLDPKLPMLVHGDEQRLKQVLMNLLGNATKFTNEGFVSLRLDQKPDGWVAFQIADTGIGMSEAALTHIFEPFHRIEQEGVPAVEGSGLGLAICRKLVDLMGGSIGVTSHPGEGTTFNFEIYLPLSEVSESSDVMEDGLPSGIFEKMARHGRLKILVADDSRENQAVMQSYLEFTNHELFFADNGVEALAAFKKHHPDLVFMDLLMPQMSGYEAAAAIREHEQEIGLERTPIAALTAVAMKDDARKAIDAGCDIHLSKPVRRYTVLTIIERLLSRRDGKVMIGQDQIDQQLSANGPAGEEVLNMNLVSELRFEVGQNFERIVRMFLEKLQGDVAQLSEVLHTGDLDSVVHAVHQLKGNASIFGAEQFQESCGEISKRFRAEGSGDYSQQLAALQVEAGRLSDALEALLAERQPAAEVE